MLKLNVGYKYWHLVKEIAVTDFKLKYEGSILGYFWSLAKPLVYFMVLYIIFTKIFKVGAAIPHYPIYLLTGVLIFTFWSDATSEGMRSIVSRGDLIRKIYFPRIILVIASTFTAFLTFISNALIVIVFIYFNDLSLSWSMLLIPLYIAELYIFILGVSFYLSSLFVKFRDIGQIWDLTNQILFYATPILYVISQVPVNYAKYMVLSPLAQVILDVRRCIIGPAILTTRDYWTIGFLPVIFVVFIFITGYLLFNRMAAKFAEEV